MNVPEWKRDGRVNWWTCCVNSWRLDSSITHCITASLLTLTLLLLLTLTSMIVV